MFSKHEHYKNWLSEVCDRSQQTLKDLDYEKVIRCKDCKHHDGKDGQCPVQSTGDPFYDYKPDDNWYCAYGERKE